jgi:hypothetical protein
MISVWIVVDALQIYRRSPQNKTAAPKRRRYLCMP